jgi:hypothetical protein
LRLSKPHRYATYGIVPSNTPSSDDELDDALPPSVLTAPIEALQGLANAAAEAAAVDPNVSPRFDLNLMNTPSPDNQIVDSESENQRGLSLFRSMPFLMSLKR